MTSSTKSKPNTRRSRDDKPSKTPKHAARYVAAHGVRAVLCDGTPLDIALSEQALFAQMERRDRAFARIIAATVFRRIGQIDKVLAPFVKKRPTDYALAVLRTGAAQILFLDTPAYAAVNGSVALLRRSKKTAHMAGMVNAVLRRVGEQGADLLEKTTTLDNIPDWVLTTWQSSYGVQAAQDMADIFVQEPPLDITIKTGAENPFLNLPLQAGLAGQVEQAENTSEDETQEPEVKPEILLGGSVRLAKAGDVRALPGYEAGDWWVQDVSAALPVRVLEAVLKAQGTEVKGKYVLDMCAAPGGKTLQLASSGAVVTALDKNPVRLERVTENLQRTNLSAHIVAEDAIKWRGANRPDGQGGSSGGFDCVVLDAPCTATGTFRRRPDVLRSKRPEDIDSLARIQEKLLLSAARHVRPGGVLIYCTCSLQRREGEEQIAHFMQNRTDFRLNSPLDLTDLLPPEAVLETGAIRVLPHYMKSEGGMDGFFIAALTRH